MYLGNRESPHGVVVNRLDCNIIGSEFKLQSCDYIHFRTNTLWEKYKLVYLLSYGLNMVSLLFYQDSFGIK